MVVGRTSRPEECGAPVRVGEHRLEAEHLAVEVDCRAGTSRTYNTAWFSSVISIGVMGEVSSEDAADATDR